MTCEVLDVRDLFLTQVSDVSNTNMVQEISNEEIKAAMLILMMIGLQVQMGICLLSLIKGGTLLGWMYHKHCKDLNIINVCSANDLFIFSCGDVDSTQGELPVKYLGVPLISSRLLNRDCKILVEKAKNHVEDWKNKSLSFAGRLQLCKLVISSMHVYWASVLVIPKGILQDIQQLIRGFMWCNGEYKRGRAKVAWDDICLPKHEGGLVSDMEANGAWLWPHAWLQKAPILGNILASNLNNKGQEDRMRQWYVGTNVVLNMLRCPLCESQKDTYEHLFFKCSFSALVWNSVRHLAGMDHIQEKLNDVVLFLKPMENKRTANIIGRLILAATSYFIWLEQNNRTFKKAKKNLKQIKDIIMVTVSQKLLMSHPDNGGNLGMQHNDES
nr:reverse transcriptase domain, reverse transcriptase zinc-binding domain protein [Tanacetum cinerariifolium]